MQKVDLPTSFTKLNENCGLPDFFTDYQIRHLGNPSGLPGILLKIDPCQVLSDLSDSQKQIITGRNVVPVGLAMQAMFATVTTELVVFSSAGSFIRQN